MDYIKPFTFAFEDKDWVKKLGYAAVIALVCTLLFILPLALFVIGYTFRTARNVIAGQKDPLPEINDIGEMIIDGLKFLVVGIVYALPILLLYGILFGIIIFSGSVNEESIGVVGGVSASIVYCLVLIYAIFLGFLQPALMLQYLRSDGDIGRCLNVMEVWNIAKNHAVPSILFLLVTIAASFFLQVATAVSIITICGPIVIYFAGIPWLGAVQGHLIGQFYDEVDGGGFSEKSPDDLAYS